MNQIISCQLTPKQIADLQAKISPDKLNFRVQYTVFQAKLTGCTITAYTSGKVVFAGEDARIFAAPYQANIQPTKTKAKPSTATVALDQATAGSDEVGTGDYFGPVCVCACIVESHQIAWIQSLSVNDSKQVNDQLIRKVAPQLMEALPYSLLVLDNPTYNRVHQSNNMNQIKAKLHNQAYVHLRRKQALPTLSIVDQFMPKENYYRAIRGEAEVVEGLHFETKAESKYLAVACASFIARYAFLKAMDQLSQHYQLDFPKGAGTHVDLFGKTFVEKYSIEALVKVAKVHFKNTEKIQELL